MAYEPLHETEKLQEKKELTTRESVEAEIQKIADKRTALAEQVRKDWATSGKTEDEIQAKVDWQLKTFDEQHEKRLRELHALLIQSNEDGTIPYGQAVYQLNETKKGSMGSTLTALEVAEAIKITYPTLYDAFQSGDVKAFYSTDEHKREYTIHLVDERTGKTYTIRDIYNVSGKSYSSGSNAINFDAVEHDQTRTAP